jgi:hypothetical protein
VVALKGPDARGRASRSVVGDPGFDANGAYSYLQWEATVYFVPLVRYYYKGRDPLNILDIRD